MDPGRHMIIQVLYWLLDTSVLKRGSINSHSIGNFDLLLIALRLDT
jgi:hypothetical protein